MKEIIVTVKEAVPAVEKIAYQGRWGFYPCSYETFLKIKEIHKAYYKAVRQEANWMRWYRKDVQNRIIRKRIYNEAGRCIGYDISPRPEPTLSPIFHEKYNTVSNWDKNGKWCSKPITVEHISICHNSIESDYKNARYPKKTAEETEPLIMSEEKIDMLYNAIKK